MRLKKEYAILVIVIVALLLYLILRNPNRTHYSLPRIPDVSRTNISKIEISKTGTTIVLNKKDNKWYIAPQQYLAETNKVKNMLDIIEKLTVTALVSESKNYDRYDLKGDKKIVVRAWDGDTLRREFEVGKAASSYRHTFVKLSGDDRVYHARENFRDKFDQTMDNLRDKTVLSFEQSDIREISITKGDQPMVFTRAQAPVEVSTNQKADTKNTPSTKTETLWQSSDGKKADESKLNNLLSTLSNLRCQKYIYDRKKGEFRAPIYTVQLKGAKKYSLSIFAKMDKEAKDYPALSSESDYPFVLSGWQSDNIMRVPE